MAHKDQEWVNQELIGIRITGRTKTFDSKLAVLVSIVEDRGPVRQRQREETLLMEDVVDMWTAFELNYAF